MVVIVVGLLAACASDPHPPAPAVSVAPIGTRAAAAEPAEPAATARLSTATVTLEGRLPLSEALRQLSAQTGVALELDPGLDGPAAVRLAVRRQPWERALSALLHAGGLRAVRAGGGLRVGRGQLPGLPFDPPPETPPPVPPPLPPPGGARAIDLNVEGADLAQVVARIAEQAGVPIAVDPDVHERVSAALTGVPWREALEVLARLARCEVVEARGRLLVRRPEEVLLDFTAADVRTLLELLAAYGGHSLVIAPEAPRVEITLRQRARLAPLRLSEALGAASGLMIERRGDLLLVGAAAGWGSLDLDSEPVPLPEPAATQPPVRLRARGAPVRPILGALARLAGYTLVSGPLPPAWLQLDREGDPGQVLRAVLAAAGLEARVEGQLLVVLGAHGPARTSPPVSAELTLKDGRRVGLGVEATLVLVGDEAELDSRALIDGRLYAIGDPLRDPATGQPLQVELAYVAPDGLLLTGEALGGDGQVRIEFP